MPDGAVRAQGDRSRATPPGWIGAGARPGVAALALHAWAALLLAVAMAAPAIAGSRADVVDPLIFERIGNAEQISDGVVTGLAQDDQGLLWIATTGGLVRHDGYRFRAYRHDPADAASLPGNVVRVVHRARDGRIWIGTEAEGVARYDPATDRFERFGEAEGIPRLPVRALADDAEGGLWIGTTGGGLLRLAPASRRVEVWRHSPADAGGLPDDRIASLLVDRDGHLWVGTWRGLARRRAGTGAFERVLSEPGDPLGFATARIRTIAQVGSGDLWVGAQQGQTAVLPHALLGRPEPPRVAEVWRWLGAGLNAVAEPRAGEIWIGHPAGIDVHAADDGRLLREVRAMPGRALGLDPAEVRALLVDASGLLWIGSFGGGVQRVDPRPSGLLSRRLVPGIDPPLPQFNVLTMGGDGVGGLWLGLAGVGLARMGPDLALGELVPPGRLADGGFEGEQPSGVAVAADGSLWVGTERGLFRRPAGAFHFLRVAGPVFLEGSAVRRLWPAADGGLWIGTADGLFHANADGSELLRLGGARGEPVIGSIEAMAFDAEGAWVGGPGLLRLDPATRTLRPLDTRIGGISTPLDVNGLLVDAGGTLWLDAGGLHRVVGTVDGAVEMEAVSARHGEDGVSFGANLLADEAGRVWSHRAVYDPAADRFQRLLPADGAQVGTGWFRSYARFGDGRLAFGAREGVLVVTPDAFAPWAYTPPVVVTEVRIDGRPQALGPEARELRVARGQRGFSIEFASLDFSAPSRNRHRYRLEGVDEGWIEVPPESRVASYGNLWPGRYRFVVQGSNRAGAWGAERVVLDVVVERRWWQTPAFVLLLFAAVALLATLLVRWRTRALERARQALEREVERRTGELRVLSEALQARTREFEEASLTDPLTGLRNRRFMSTQMATEMSLWMRRRPSPDSGEPSRDMVVFLIDIDHFKAVNDRYGHAAGDELLRQFAARLREVFRASDHLVRWGGEEFLVVARDTHRDGAPELAERVRTAVADRPFLHEGQPVAMTASIGWVPLPWDVASPQALDWEALVALADLALYTVKQGGRNGWLGLLPNAPLPPEADLAWLTKRLPRLLASGDLALASNLDLDRLAHLIATQSR